MMLAKSVALMLAAAAAPVSTSAQEIEIGQEICVTGYIMDTFCINLGRLLDDRDRNALLHPEDHSFHCLLDVGVCFNSGFQVLGEKNEDGVHCLGYRLDDPDDKIVAMGRSIGWGGAKRGRPEPCSTCTNENENAPDAGVRLTIRGVVSDLGDGSNEVSGQPVLSDIEVFDDSEECETPAPQTVCNPDPSYWEDEGFDPNVPPKSSGESKKAFGLYGLLASVWSYVAAVKT